MPRSTYLKVLPMRFTCAATILACVALVSFGGDSVHADQVDDLLAGKSIKLDAAVAREPATDQAAADVATKGHSNASGSTELPDVPRNRLSEKPWELTLADPDQVGMAAAAGNDANRPSAPPTATISLVPEPSTIALAAAALVYFLIFFRRRYSF
jgi:hypothetical protein